MLPLLGYAQREQENWFMGTYLGMKFQGNTMSVIPVNTSKMYASYGSATWSDPVTGELLFYTNGNVVYNRQHKQMPNGAGLNSDNMPTHTMIVPNPADKNLFYVFSSPATSTGLFYAEVDMRLQGGMGDVPSPSQFFVSSADLAFCIVRQASGEGYWLITHTATTDEFRAYPIGSKGLELNPVVSHAGSVSPDKPGYIYAKMISNSTGDRFVFSHGNHNSGGPKAICEEFVFDKDCGVIRLSRAINPPVLQAEVQLSYPAYSPDNNRLYVSWIYDSGQSSLVQYDLTAPDPGNTYKIISSGNNYNGDLQLAPDGKIYMATSENSAVTGKISVINKPNLTGTACDFKDRAVTLAADPSLYYTEHFPEFIMDQVLLVPGKEKPEMVFEDECVGSPVTFTLKQPLTADSIVWDFGDGDTSATMYAVHTYNAPGAYLITFNWYTCGYKHTASDTLKIRPVPQVDLGNDTLLCAGVKIQLTASDADEYLWNTGKKSPSISVSKPGTYWVKVKNGSCTGTDTVVIRYHNPLWIALGDEYYICDDDRELVKLDAGGDFNEYKWTPTGDTTQWIIVGDVGKYFVVVKDFRGCNAQDGTRVERRCPVSVFYPNVFTPNNDGINDVYLPVGTDVVTYALTIYNAWGQKVFTSDQLSRGWDGTFQGKPSPEGTYVYQSTYSGYRNKKQVSFEEKGSITLLR
jgi:gliding motility-associated-like protein